MSDMFWIAIKVSDSKMGLIIRLSLLVLKLAVFKNYGVGKYGNSDLILVRLCAFCPAPLGLANKSRTQEAIIQM